MSKVKEMLKNMKEEIKIAFKELDTEFEEAIFSKEEHKEKQEIENEEKTNSKIE